MEPKTKALIHKSSLYIIIVGLVAVIFFMQKCNTRSETKLIATIEQYSDSVKNYKDERGCLIVYNQTLEVQTRKQLDEIAKRDKQLYFLQQKFKYVESATSVGTEIKIVHDTIPYAVHDTIPCDFEQFCIVDTNKWYNLRAYIAPKFFILDSLQLFNNESIVIGSKKTSFWKAPERRIEVQNSNPYITTKTISSYVIKDDKKWYETKAFIFGAGFVSGFVINSRLNR